MRSQPSVDLLYPIAYASTLVSNAVIARLAHRAAISSQTHVDNPNVDLHQLVRNLETSLENLLAEYETLRHENQELKRQAQQWLHERSAFAEKTTIAQHRVEAMITRLKSMGHE